MKYKEIGQNIFDGAILLEKPPITFKNGEWITIDSGDNTALRGWESGEMLSIKTYRHCLDAFPYISFGGSPSVIIENVNLFPGASISFASALKGDLFRLAFEIGALIRLFRQCLCPVYLVNPSKWKGQLSDQQLRYVLKKKFKLTFNNNHEACATGIGLWALGEF
jgi:hypothetical protein